MEWVVVVVAEAEEHRLATYNAEYKICEETNIYLNRDKLFNKNYIEG